MRGCAISILATMDSDRRIWLDSASTTPLAPEVAEAMAPWLSAGVEGNPSSLHAEGRAARRAVEEVRDWFAGHFGVLPSHVHFTGSATEANNLAVAGVLRSLPRAERPHRVVASAMEHDSVRQCLLALEREGVAEVTWIRGDPDGLANLAAARKALSAPTALAALMHVNNETGAIQPIAQWAVHARKASPDGILHCDAVQAFARVAPEPEAADLIALSAHKMHGPPGVGVLIRRRPIPLTPLTLGGSQEGGLRAGTEPVALIVGLGAAAALAAERREAAAAHLRVLESEFLKTLEAEGVTFDVRGDAAARAPGIFSLTVAAVDSTDLVIAADLEGVALSAGSACHSGTPGASHVLAAMGLGEDQIRHTVRVALHRDQSPEEAREGARRIARVAARAT